MEPMAEYSKSDSYISYVLLANGIVNILGSIMMIFFPILGIEIPGYRELDYQTVFATGGWGIAAFTFGVARIWSSTKKKLMWFMATIGALEGILLSLYCVLRIQFSATTLAEALIPLIISTIFGCFYIIVGQKWTRNDTF